ncbi:hypothetical protein HBI81_192610 [Parastagonospora nodorum]|nr:hypothetical protein HBI09_187430 [Parastagonospora nodorum]KAH4994427.1 hypothetical protein HBI77_208480 [Parastagonospora nodorum]KAH6516263.1 hypothetical protein HBI81_192610 [Parastagonospora nodorum]
MSIPLLVRLGPSSRHELILLPASPIPSLKSLNALVTRTIGSSPNCAEPMSQHKNPETKEQIQEFKIHWDRQARDGKIWPEYTVVHEGNLEAVVEMLKVSPGRDVLEVRVGKVE